MNDLIVLIGASGSGKTTIARQLQTDAIGPELRVLYFDSIGVPSADEMQRGYGSGENWQKATTETWINNIRDHHLPHAHVVLEGQTRPSFIEDACAATGIARCRMILVDCADEVRQGRLIARCQASAADDRMMNWARYLREEAMARKLPIIDTTVLSVPDAVHGVRQCIGNLIAGATSPRW